MNQVRKELLAPCGLYCGVCAVYKAHEENNIRLKEALVPIYKGFVKNAEEVSCTGCLSDGIVFLACKYCQIKKCTSKKEIEGCHQCQDWPCSFIDNFPIVLAKKVMQRTIPAWKELGTEKFVESEERRYRCPECGNVLFRGVKKCNECKIPLDLD